MTLLGLSTATEFAVRRADFYEDDQPPCDGARPAKIARYDRRTFQTEEAHDDRFPKDPWRSRGSEHGRWHDGRQGGISRRIEDEDGWTVTVSSLDQLLELAAEFGSVTIDPPQGSAEPPHLMLGWEE